MCGVWDRSPIGPMADVMWALPDGRRRLIVPSASVGAFVSAVYGFDEVTVSALVATVVGTGLAVEAPDVGLSMRMQAGTGWPIPNLGPAWVTRGVAGPIARRVLGVRTYGVSPTGVREWYRARWYRPLQSAHGTLDGEDLGAMVALDPPVRFGFSEPPRRPSMVWVRPLLHDPSTRVEAILGH